MAAVGRPGLPLSWRRRLACARRDEEGGKVPLPWLMCTLTLLALVFAVTRSGFNKSGVNPSFNSLYCTAVNC